MKSGGSKRLNTSRTTLNNSILSNNNTFKEDFKNITAEEGNINNTCTEQEVGLRQEVRHDKGSKDRLIEADTYEHQKITHRKSEQINSNQVLPNSLNLTFNRRIVVSNPQDICRGHDGIEESKERNITNTHLLPVSKFHGQYSPNLQLKSVVQLVDSSKSERMLHSAGHSSVTNTSHNINQFKGRFVHDLTINALVLTPSHV